MLLLLQLLVVLLLLLHAGGRDHRGQRADRRKAARARARSCGLRDRASDAAGGSGGGDRSPAGCRGRL